MPAPATEAVELAHAIEMRAAVLREPRRPVDVETVVLERPRRGEVLVRVAAAGVCRSDVHLADGLLGEGRWPIVLGHEGAGVVDAVGEDVVGLAPGDHVAFCFVPACGACRACRSGRPTLCEPAGRNGVAGMLMDGTSRLRARDGTVLQHGLMVACFAQYAVVPAAGAVPLPAIDFLTEKTITGSYYGSASAHATLAELAQLVIDGRLELGDVVSDLIALDQVEDAFERLRRGEGARSVIVIDPQLAGMQS